MKASELIKMLEEANKDGDREVEFFSYEWTDDLEYLEYQERTFERVRKHRGKVRIEISR